MRDQGPHVNCTRRDQLDCQREVMLNVGTDATDQVRLLVEELVNRDVESVTSGETEENHRAVAANQIGCEVYCLFFTDRFDNDVCAETVSEIEHRCFQIAAVFTEYL